MMGLSVLLYIWTKLGFTYKTQIQALYYSIVRQEDCVSLLWIDLNYLYQKNFSLPNHLLTLKAPNKIAADDIFISYFYLSKKIRHDFSCASRGFT